MHSILKTRAPLYQTEPVAHSSSIDSSINSRCRAAGQPTGPRVSAEEDIFPYTKNGPTDNFRRDSNPSIQFSGVGAGANAAAGLKAKRVEI
jgi:hypothetical protein